MNVTELRAQHERIMRFAAELHRALDAGMGVQPVAGLRWRLAREVIAHLAVEDRLFYPLMIRSGDAAAADIASRFQAEMGGFADDFTAWLARWNELNIAQDWDAFRADTKTVLTTLADRTRREEDTLYPLAGATGLAA